MRFIVIIILLTYCILANSLAQVSANSVLAKHRLYIVKNNKPKNVSPLLKGFNETTGQWPDIDYSNNSVAAWQLIKHLNNTSDLALAWSTPSSRFYHDKAVLSTINSALSHWYQHKYQSKNWWYNEIGVPQAILESIVLLKDSWTPAQLKQSLEILAQHRVNGTGANLSWSASLGLYYGLLTADNSLVNRTSKLLHSEVKISTDEGIQPDYSFHQHGKRLQLTHYGGPFLVDNLRLAWELKGSEWAYPEDKVDILVQTLLNGWQWMSRGINNAPGTVDRAVSRKDGLKKADIRIVLPYAIELSLAHKAELQAFLNRQNGTSTLSGFRYFPYSDYAAYHQSGFSFFLKTVSTRTLPSESINGENLKGRLLNSGDGYLISNGIEYFNMMPVWNWNLLPGITTFNGAEKIIQRAFNGSVSSGSSGLAAMDYCMAAADTSKKLSAHKIWAMHGNLVVCLIAGLKADNTGPVVTVLDQSRLQGKVTTNTLQQIIPGGDHDYSNIKWVHHGRFAYLPLYNDSITLKTGTVNGSWYSINTSKSRDTVRDKVFLATLRHHAASSGYVLANLENAAATNKLAQHPTWKVVKNDGVCQAVSFNDGTLMAAFFSAGGLGLMPDALSADRPCLVLIEKGKLYASDPSHKGGKLKIILNNKIFDITLPADGTTAAAIAL